jgi:V/A-type H+/Na+-transporting ATPase subunit E
VFKKTSDIKQGLVSITNEVTDDVQKEAEKIIQEAQKTAEDILKAAEVEAEKAYDTVINDAKSKADLEKRKIESATSVDIRNQLLVAKEQLVDSVFDKALVKLKQFVKSEKYHDYLLELTKNAANVLGVKSMILHVNSEDMAWLKQNKETFAKKARVQFKIAEEPETCFGGLRVESEDGKIFYDNTIDNRVKQLKSTLRGEVAKILFEKEA